MTRVLCYARQSIEKDEGDRSLSIDSQIAVLRERCAREGWQIISEIRESGLRGWMDASERPGLAEALARADSGDYDVLLIWELARLARSVRLQEQWVWQFTRAGVQIVSHTEPESADALIRQIRGAINEYRTKEISRAVARAVRERTRRGLPHGPAPFGYVRGKKGILEPDISCQNSDKSCQPPSETVRRIFQWRSEGCSLVEISDRLHAAGVPAARGGRWSRPTLAELLANPVYTGTLRLAEVEHPNAHEAIITPETFHKAQNGLSAGRSRHPRTKQHRSWLEGAIVHACGAPMYLVGGSAGRPVLSFRCRVGGGWGGFDAQCHVQPRQIRMDRAEELTWLAISDGLKRLPKPREILRAAQQRYRLESPSAQQARADAEARARRVARERARLLDLYVSGGFARAQLDQKLAIIEAEERSIEAILDALPSLPDTEAIERAWHDLRAMRHVATLASPAARGQILRAIGVAVVSPAGSPIVRSGPGRREDAGRVRLRARPGLEGFFCGL